MAIGTAANPKLVIQRVLVLLLIFVICLITVLLVRMIYLRYKSN